MILSEKVHSWMCTEHSMSSITEHLLVRKKMNEGVKHLMLLDQVISTHTTLKILVTTRKQETGSQ